MTDWDADSDRLRANLSSILQDLRRDARNRILPTIENARAWHVAMMKGLTPPHPDYAGRFRGESKLEYCNVRVGSYIGTLPPLVGADLAVFENKIQSAVDILDQSIDENGVLDVDQLNAVLRLCAWAHSEWVRIHPFANGNGRTARLWANFIAMRYGLPPFVRLRPRPDGGYGDAAADAMKGNWQATEDVFRRMYTEAIRSHGGRG